jgi:hypothetical protein
LQIVDYCNRHPGVARQEIRRPLIIAGLPRTGTTILYELLAQDPAHRCPMTWEVDYPYPPPEESNALLDPRIQEAQKRLDHLYQWAPALRAIHPMGASLPQECQAADATRNLPGCGDYPHPP